jgi:ubiquinone/menaquinone biosynthesis C-methylase UbiE
MRWEWYDKNILPAGIDQTCSVPAFAAQRARVVPGVSGRVLEIGSGTGLNLPYYDAAKVERVFALDPSPEMHALAAPRIAESGLQVESLTAGAESIPLDAASVDTVLLTYTLCTIDGPIPALEEMRRVLRPGGRLVFAEHGLGPSPWIRFCQHACNPVWSFLSGGCRLNRDIPKVIESGPWRVEGLEAGYIPGWRPLNYNFWGAAVPR